MLNHAVYKQKQGLVFSLFISVSHLCFCQLFKLVWGLLEGFRMELWGTNVRTRHLKVEQEGLRRQRKSDGVSWADSRDTRGIPRTSLHTCSEWSERFNLSDCVNCDFDPSSPTPSILAAIYSSSQHNNRNVSSTCDLAARCVKTGMHPPQMTFYCTAS